MNLRSNMIWKDESINYYLIKCPYTHVKARLFDITELKLKRDLIDHSICQSIDNRSITRSLIHSVTHPPNRFLTQSLTQQAKQITRQPNNQYNQSVNQSINHNMVFPLPSESSSFQAEYGLYTSTYNSRF